MACGVIAAFCLGSCLTTSDELNLDKEISLDMQIGRGGISIPLGSIDTLYVDSLIKVDGDNSSLDTLDGGLYGFSLEDSISKIDIGIDPVEFDIDDPTIDPLETSFDKPEVKDVEIAGKPSETLVKIGKFDVSGINSKLPKLSTSYDKTDIPAVGIGAYYPDPIEVTFDIDEREVQCGFSYDMPDDVKKINSVYFGDKGSQKGQKLTLKVDLSGVFSLLTSPEIWITDFKIKFPSNFTVAVDPSLSDYIPANEYYISGTNSNIFNIAMSSAAVKGIGSDGILPITFYLKSADFSDYTGSIDFTGDKAKVKYEMGVKISGKALFEGMRTFDVSVTMDNQLSMADVEAETNSKFVTIDADTVSSSCQVSGLAGISSVDNITFDADKSFIYMAFSALDIDPFELKSGTQNSKFEIIFPAEYTFDDTFCKDENNFSVGTWSGNKLTIDASKAMGHTVRIKVESIAVNEPVNAATSSIDISTDVIYSGYVTVDGASDVTLADLDSLKDQKVTINVSGKFIVDNAVVTTDRKVTEFNDSTEISVEHDIDEALAMLKRIDLVNPANAMLNLVFDGVPSTMSEIKFEGFTIEFPDFITLDYLPTQIDRDNRITVVGNSLYINGALSDELHSAQGFTIKGLQISGMEFKKPLYTPNGHLSIQNAKVRFHGSVTVENQQIKDTELDVIKVTPTVHFETIKVKSVYGKVNPKIDPVDEEVEISLGSDIDFLKNDGTTLKLSDPQIAITLNSTVTLPIDIDLKLSSVDDKGAYIAKDIMPDAGTIHLAACDTSAQSRKTTLFIHKNARPASTSSDTVFVLMSRLSDLMERMPDKIMFNLTAKADTTVNHYIDLTRELSVSGDYRVSIPLSFDSLYVEYSDTIKELGKDLEDIADKINAATVQIAADVESTIPMGVTLTAKAYDKRGRVLNTIEIDSCSIAPGTESGSKSSMVLGVKVKDGALADLESIVFTAACQSGQGSSSVRKGQYIYLDKIRLKLPEGLVVDLTEKKK